MNHTFNPGDTVEIRRGKLKGKTAVVDYVLKPNMHELFVYVSFGRMKCSYSPSSLKVVK